MSSVSREESPSVPFRNLHGLVASTLRERWQLVGDVEPLRPPPSGVVGQISINSL
jgi:hypothetical protein